METDSPCQCMWTGTVGWGTYGYPQRGKVSTLGHVKKRELQKHVLSITCFKTTPSVPINHLCSEMEEKVQKAALLTLTVLGGTSGRGNRSA